MKNFSLIQLTASFGILVVSLSLAYYFIIFIPQKELFDQQQVKRAVELEERKISAENEKTSLRASCEAEAGEEATNLLKNKLELAEGSYIYDTYKDAVDKGMYLKDDYNSYYERCLQRYGLE